MVNSAAPLRVFAAPGDCEIVRRAYAEALKLEIAKILEQMSTARYPK
jgi:hypothetical protein